MYGLVILCTMSTLTRKQQRSSRNFLIGNIKLRMLGLGTNKAVFSIEISSKNQLSASTEEILATDNRLRKKSVENR